MKTGLQSQEVGGEKTPGPRHGTTPEGVVPVYGCRGGEEKRRGVTKWKGEEGGLTDVGKTGKTLEGERHWKGGTRQTEPLTAGPNRASTSRSRERSLHQFAPVPLSSPPLPSRT